MKSKRLRNALMWFLVVLIIYSGYVFYYYHYKYIPLVNAEDFIATYQDNEILANNLYLNKLLKVRGTLITNDTEEQALYLKGNTQFYNIKCQLRGVEDIQKAATLHNEQSVIIMGYYIGDTPYNFFNNLTIDPCVTLET